MNKNIQLYHWYKAALDAMAWLPVFFLYFSEYLSLQEVLLLEAIYYGSVVVLEVPSGYFSDVLGRKKTLVVSAIMFCVSYLLFLAGQNFTVFAAAQFCLAAGISFRSGTDTVFHYESLLDAGLEKEYGSREARAARISLITSGIAVFIGGWLGAWNLRWAYGISLVGAMVGLGILLFYFKEPENERHGTRGELPIIQQLQTCFAYLKNPKLAWLFVFWVLLYVLMHVPYEFYQPYLKLLEQDGRLAGSNAPFISGVLFALTRFVSSYFAGISIKLRDKFGLKKLLVVAFLIQLFIVGILAMFLHPVIVLVIIFRNLSYDIIAAPVQAVVTPMIASGQRATYFSIQSLVCRLGFSLSLVISSAMVSTGETLSWPGLSSILMLFFVAGTISFAGLMIFIKKLDGAGE